MNERTYEQLGRLARAQLAAGTGVIVDATFRFRGDREAFARGLSAPAPLDEVPPRNHVVLRTDRRSRRSWTTSRTCWTPTSPVWASPSP